MKIIKTIYYFVAILVLIIIGIDMLKNMEISIEEVIFPILTIVVAIIVLFPFVMIVWEEYQEYRDKHKIE